MLKVLEKELIHLKQVDELIEKSIKNAPEGTVRCSSCKGIYQYYQGRQYIAKDRIEYIKQLAQKTYCLSLKDKLSTLRNLLEQITKIYRDEELENMYRCLAASRKAVVEPLFKPIEEIINEFESIQYKGKEFEEHDTTEYFTSKGERVRSKSEMIIADELYRNNIPYKYEMPIELNSWNKRITIYTNRKWIISLCSTSIYITK